MPQRHTQVAALIEVSAGRDRAGQGLAEYALILTLVVIIAILALLFLGSDIRTLLSAAGASV
jgi:Flp pilus assembly pilin Flp